MRLFGRESSSDASPEVGREEESPVSAVLALAADRLAEIVGAADRAVADIRRETATRLPGSAASGDKINRERLVAELAASLVKRADELSHDAAALAQVLERASTRLESSSRPAVTPVVEPAESPVALDLDRTVSERFNAPASGAKVPFRGRRAEDVRPRETTSSPQKSSDGLRLLATQMAVAGSSRAEIERLMRTEFGIEDIDGLLGPADSEISRERRHG